MAAQDGAVMMGCVALAMDDECIQCARCVPGVCCLLTAHVCVLRVFRGTYHFRTTILPSEATLDDVLGRMRVFHTNFIKTYA